MRTADKSAKVAQPVASRNDNQEEFNSASGFVLETEVVYRERVKIPFSESGKQTIGQMIDAQLYDLAKNDGEMRHFGITFDDASWNDAKEAYKHFNRDFFNVSPYNEFS